MENGPNGFSSTVFLKTKIRSEASFPLNDRARLEERAEHRSVLSPPFHLWPLPLQRPPDDTQNVSCGSLTYAGLLKGDGGGSFAQGVDRGHVDFVGGGGEDLREADVTAVLVVRILLHLQRALVVSVDTSKGRHHNTELQIHRSIYVVVID